MAKIQLNGKKVTVKNNDSIFVLLKKYKFLNKKVAVEYNGTIVAKENFKKKLLKNNDSVEIVHFIGGG